MKFIKFIAPAILLAVSLQAVAQENAREARARVNAGEVLRESIKALRPAATAPKYIFYFIGDGMGMAPLQAAHVYKRLALGDSLPLNMQTLPVASAATTHSFATPVTDSAAAGTALATGHKTLNGMIGMTPDTVAVVSIADRLADLGYGIGLVTTVAPDDATPAAFYAHVPSRHLYREIGRQAADSRVSFLAGSSLRGAYDKDGVSTGLIEYITDKGVSIVHDPDSVAIVGNERVFLLAPTVFNSSSVGYTLDDRADMLTLEQMTATAINHLQAFHPERFFLMVEGGNIDHALHSNDAATAMIETLAFDNTLRQALEFYEAHPEETLIVVSADHDTGGLSIGDKTTGYAAYPQLLMNQKYSKDRFSILCEDMISEKVPTPTWEDMKQFLAENVGLFSLIEMSEADEEALRADFERIIIGRQSKDSAGLYAKYNEFAQKVYTLLDDRAGFGFTTPDHSGNPVPVFAIGVGAENFSQWADNTDLPKRIMKVASGQE